MLATLSGVVHATIQDGVVRGFDLASATALLSRDGAPPPGLRQALMGGRTMFQNLAVDAAVKGGLATVTGAMAAPAGLARLDATIDLPAGLIDGRIGLSPAEAENGTDSLPDGLPAGVSDGVSNSAREGRPPLGIRLLGPVGAPRRTPDLTALARWLAARP